ncbi:MAG: dynamin family protein, partial [Muribaculaceae bacterium]|nr:dynamin family protein [Muribaculaceae bacterium]
MISPEQYKQKASALAGIINRQAALLAETLDSADSAEVVELKTLAAKIENEDFRVLLMGRFSSGKSTFLNALMGEMLLPALPKPTTAMIGEISYAEKPEAVLVHHDSSKPDLRIPTADLGKYIVIDHTNRSDEDTQNPYSKVFIRYPLDVCRNGVMFVDSPGLDDPTCHDEITADYLPNADAIIYCMNIQNAYSAKDAMEIERLRNLGYTSIVFVFTYFDCIEANDRMMGTDQARATRDHYLAQTEGLTDMGRDGIFFVGSLPALAAKINKNQALLDSSYLPAVEKRLERLLFQEKGHMKLMRAVGAARNAGREVNQRVADLTELASNDRAHLNDRVNAAQTILNNARAKADNIGRQFSIGIGSIANESKDMVRAFLALEILPSIERYLDDFQPSEEANISFMHPKRTSRKYTEECIVHIQGKIESAFGAWIRDRLVGEFLEPRLRSLLAQQEGNIKALQTDLSQIRAELKIGTGVDEVGDQNDSLFN